MSLEKIRESVIGKAQKEKEEIIARAKEGCEQKVRTAREVIKEVVERRLRGIEAEFREEIKRQIASLNREHRLRLLEMKNRIIDDIFIRAVDKVINLPDDKYLAMMERRLLKVDSNLPGKLFVNARDIKRMDQLFIDRINSRRQGDSRIDLNQDPIDIKGGFVFKTNKFEIDQTLDTIMVDLEKELAPMIAKELFYGK